jgi:glycosyltransferase involved in cell wall biosynthesis
MRIRAAIITTGFSKDDKDYGGAAAFHNFVKELSQHEEIDVTVFAFYYPINQPEYRFYNAKIFSAATGKTGSILSKLITWRKSEKKFAEEHKKEKFHLIHSLWSRESGFTASRLSRKFRVPLIANVGGGELADLKEINYGSRVKQLQKYFVDKTFSRANIIVSGSDYITDKIKNYYDEHILSKVRKIPFGADEDMFNVMGTSTREAPDKKLPVLINIANAVPVKAHKILFAALKIVSGKFPGIKLECYGRDDKNILQNLAHQSGVTNNISIKGFISYEDIPRVLNKEAIFVLSSLYESQNMAIIEAAFCGLPVVSTNAGAASEITENIAEPGNPESLAEKIIYVIENYSSEKQKALHKT